MLQVAQRESHVGCHFCCEQADKDPPRSPINVHKRYATFLYYDKYIHSMWNRKINNILTGRRMWHTKNLWLSLVDGGSKGCEIMLFKIFDWISVKTRIPVAVFFLSFCLFGAFSRPVFSQGDGVFVWGVWSVVFFGVWAYYGGKFWKAGGKSDFE
jgi:hypothetical protein